MLDLHTDVSSLKNFIHENYPYVIPDGYHQAFQEECGLHLDYNRWLSEPSDLPDWLHSVGPQLSEEKLLDRAKGSLVGLAAGDAVGTTLEFLPRDQKYVDDMTGGGPFQLKAGEWTDDTSMALCLAETYVYCHDLNVTDFRNRLVNWYHYGTNSSNGICFDIGNATRHALDAYLQHGDEWFGNNDAHTAGNAAIIRLAPAAIFHRHSLLHTLAQSELQGKATHGAIESMDCCRLLGMILHHLLNGAEKSEALATKTCPLNARTALINAGIYKNKTREHIRSSGYVIDTLEAALWAVWNTSNFHDAILLAANLADDADSVAATAGQIAGALYGYSGIPKVWRDRLVEEERISGLAEQLWDDSKPYKK
ncbi:MULTISPECIES: ADP-ribosylarginine hydrolase Tri1 [unclassified Brenneria]|uniref:ADP-ribosylarginine hydrolase Tri1 n=1 Tax=unclassified Brenneria TaxID=2634434 RepID=UPI0029C5C9D2|nr:MULTISPECIES: ADP-ribosylarginine hydrolase Tri1 [unclassified Brenneria]MDX5630993.1 ADP-ribosylarginine hydrolase Tri1 [Brenneria sp. L3-3Z]MDX5698074.1 ADP-ribosylarginine hydrolase Tri1 [Brenneria sp. L4-2C]